MVGYYQNIFLWTFPWFQTQIIEVDKLQGMSGHDIFQRGFGLLSFEGKSQAALSNVFLCLSSHARPKEPVTHEIEHVFQT